MIFSHFGNPIIGQLQEEYKIWDGGQMVAFGFLFVAVDFFSAKELE